MTGAGGQLATHVEDQLRTLGADVTALARADLDITSADAVAAVIATLRPDVVINAAAYTAVDAAEQDPDAAQRVNAEGPRALAQALARYGGRLLHVSTDYVFDGTARSPYETTDPPAPRGVYGRTKLAGERAVRAELPDDSWVVRTAWVYGGPRRNFVDTMLRLERERDTVDVVTDQTGSPTWAADLGSALVELGSSASVPPGVLHYANAGRASWFDLARETFRLAGADPARVHPVDSSAFPLPAARPAWSVLSTASWTDVGLGAPRAWQHALAAAMAARA